MLITKIQNFSTGQNLFLKLKFGYCLVHLIFFNAKADAVFKQSLDFKQKSFVVCFLKFIVSKKIVIVSGIIKNRSRNIFITYCKNNLSLLK